MPRIIKKSSPTTPVLSPPEPAMPPPVILPPRPSILTNQLSNSKSHSMSKLRPFVLYIVLAVVALAGAGTGYFYYRQYTALKANPGATAQAETEALVARVSKLIVLPEGETPTVATVQDPEKLKDQAFFVNAKVGFKVLIYTNAKKAILYDPVANKIVEVAPVNIGNQAAAPVPSDSETTE